MDPGGARHPLSREWEARYKRSIPGGTLADQLSAVSAWWERDQRDMDARALALWGTGSAIENAVGALRTDADWADRLRESASRLRNADGIVGSFVSGGSFISGE
jgi:hypothetical protein